MGIQNLTLPGGKITIIPSRPGITAYVLLQAGNKIVEFDDVASAIKYMKPLRMHGDISAHFAEIWHFKNGQWEQLLSLET